MKLAVLWCVGTFALSCLHCRADVSPVSLFFSGSPNALLNGVQSLPSVGFKDYEKDFSDGSIVEFYSVDPYGAGTDNFQFHLADASALGGVGVDVFGTVASWTQGQPIPDSAFAISAFMNDSDGSDLSPSSGGYGSFVASAVPEPGVVAGLLAVAPLMVRPRRKQSVVSAA